MSGELGGVTDQSVLLLNAVPSLLSLNLFVLPDLVGEVSEVGVGGDELLEGLVLPLPGLAKNEDVVAEPEGITEVSYGLNDNLGLLSDGLVGRRAIVVPHGDVFE